MATMSVWRFDDPDTAGEAVRVLEELQKEGQIQVLDATSISWPVGKRGPKTHPLHGFTTIGAVGGGFFGVLMGAIFLVPLLGLAIGAAAGAATGRFADVGLNDALIAEVQAKVTPGTSALFVLTEKAVPERVAEAFSGFHAELITSNLSDEQEKILLETFYSE